MKNLQAGIRIVVPILMILGVTAYGDTLSGSGGLQTWSASALGTPSNPTPSGTPYWNNVSGDGPDNNIGWCLTGTGGCTIAHPPGTPAYYGNSNGTAANTMTFTASGAAVTASLLGVFSNQNGVPNGMDYFGWYSINPNNTLGPLTTLLSSMSPIGATATFSPSGQYGFFLENVQSGGLPAEADYYWFTNSSFDYASGTGTSDGKQHFSTFSLGNGGYIFGMEDTNGAKADNDFNDLIVQVQNTPEPVTFCMLGGGLLLIALVCKRRSVRI